MLSFQRLDVYRAAIDLLSLLNRIRAHIPRGNADLLDQLGLVPDAMYDDGLVLLERIVSMLTRMIGV